MMLGVRPHEVQLSPTGDLFPGAGGLSVFAGLRDLLPHMIPSRLRHIVPDAAGDDRVFVWAMGDGPFVPAPVAPGLTLRVDPDDLKHGFIEPEVIMPLEEYQAALAATQDLWVVDER